MRTISFRTNVPHYLYTGKLLLLVTISALLLISTSYNSLVVGAVDVTDGAKYEEEKEPTSSRACAADASGGDTAEGKTCQEAPSSTDHDRYKILGNPNEYVESSVEGVNLAMRRWVPSDGVKAVILFHHGGAGWHSGYSDIMGRYMASQGIAVIAYDTAGSGYSTGSKVRGHFDSMDTVANDFTKMLAKVRAEYPQDTKVFAMGESFGCMILLHQILKETAEGGSETSLADGYIFTGPVVKVLPEMLPPKPVISIVAFVARFFPMLQMPGTDFFSTFDLAFGDPQWALTGRSDPLIQEAALLRPRLGMMSSVLTAMSRINDSLEKIEVPFIIFMGENDARVDVDAVKRLADVARSKDKAIEVVPGGYHQLFQDMPNVTDLVCRNIQEWVLARS